MSVEVVSPSDSAAGLHRKVHQYLEAGAQSVWVVYPQTGHVIVFRRNGTLRELRQDDLLEEPEILPKFSVKISSFFRGA